jgi:hypothetical protein
LLEAINFQRLLRDQKFPKCPWVFFGETGERILDFRGSWDTACIKAGLCKTLTDEEGNELKDKKGEPVLVPNKLFHDFRRTAIRNMINAGVPEVVAMRISGHRTRSVFDRYAITDERDLRRASERVGQYHLEQFEKENKHNSSIIAPIQTDLHLGEHLTVN